MTSPFFIPAIGPMGELIQSASAKIDLPPGLGATRANGLLVRGVVTAVHRYSVNPASPGPITSRRPDISYTAIYADVLINSTVRGMHFGYLPNCLVAQERSGLHDGDIWVPRVATIDITGAPIGGGANEPANLDGDFVLVGFMDDDLTHPVILRSIPHPNADKIVGALPAQIDKPGHRLHINETDVDDSPRYTRHRGVFHGVNSIGNYVIDTSRGSTGLYGANGTEPAPTLSGFSGNVSILLPHGSKLKVEVTSTPDDPITVPGDKLRFTLESPFGGSPKLKLDLQNGETLTLTGAEDVATLKLGIGDVHPAISEALSVLWADMVEYVENATVMTALGPSGPIVGNSGPAPTYPDSVIQSDRVSFPDNL